MQTTQQTAQNLTAFATVASCARPVEQYLRRLDERPDAHRSERSALSLRPVDAFLLHQLAAMLPSPPDVIDLAADATGGASTALWAAHPAVREVWAPRRPGAPGWRDRFDECTDGAAAPLHLDLPPLAGATDWKALAAAMPSREVLVLIGGNDGEEAAAVAAATLAQFPDATVAVMGVGRTGDDGALEALLRFRREHPGHRLRALRELSPFLADSDLAVIHRADRPAAPAALERVAQAFEGNFQFVNLVQAVATAASDGATAAGVGEDTGRRHARRASARPAEQDYEGLVERVRAVVRDAVSDGGSVLVVSKGDDALVKIDGRRAAHFPQTAQGAYAGHHPADDAAAIAHLSALRAKGARYLALPATSVWWLEHYDGFRRHLEETATVKVCRPDTCIVFDLALSAAGARAPKRAAAAAVPYPRVVEQVRLAVANDTVPGATVAVVSKGDSELIDLPGRRGVHFPQTPDGSYAGHHPADGAAAIDRLDAARGRGAEYLVIPASAFWWLDHYPEFRRHLDEQHRLIRDEETCVLYRLAGTGRPAAGWSWLARPVQLLNEFRRRFGSPGTREARAREAGRAAGTGRHGREGDRHS